VKHAIVVGHPNPQSFTMSVANAYSDAVLAGGGRTTVRDLYALGFNPCLQRDELPTPGFSTGDDVDAERAAIADADVFVFVYPLWFNAPPAIVIGYIQRVFGMGFGFAAGLMGNRPLLTGKKLVSLTSSGAPAEWLQQEGGWSALRNLFDDHVAGVCGLTATEHHHFGQIGPGTSNARVKECLAEIAKLVHRVSR
jgi:NAD(P)H dehydrogenase (quinone)